MNSCAKPVGVPNCKVCDGKAIRYGKTGNRQRYRCKSCKVTFHQTYRNIAWSAHCDQNIVSLLTEGCGIRSIARLLRLATGTVIKRIKQLATRTIRPQPVSGRTYEVDELKTFVGSKQHPCWVILALDRSSGSVIDIKVGKRNIVNLRSVTDRLLAAGCKHIYTDRLNIYSSVIPVSTHKVTRYGTNKIERVNLSIRTHLKRLNRKTICYSKCPEMLEACLKLYFWQVRAPFLQGYSASNTKKI